VPCPWDALEPANLAFCEESLCAWVTQPANTWTNIGFIVAGVWILRRSRARGNRVVGALGFIALATGIGSALFHATSSLVGQLADQAAMFLESGFFIVANMARWRALSVARFVLGYLAIVATSTTLLVLFPSWGIGLFVAHVAVFLSLECALYFRFGRTTRYGALLVVGILFLLSFVVWWLDRTGVICHPQNHYFTGHGLWHLLGAASFVYWYEHYTQFALLRASPRTTTARELS
jgi:hypothetical protein